MVEFIFIVLASILFIGFLGELIFKKTKIPDVIWLIIIGILIGSVLKWVSADDFSFFAPIFTTFALIFLLFEAGLNMKIKLFLESAGKGLKLTIISFILSFIVIFLIGTIIGMGLGLSLLMAGILSGISSAVVIPMVSEINIGKKAKLALIFDSAFSDVLCILSTVTLIEILLIKQFNFWNITNSLLASFLIAILTGFIFALVWTRIVHKIMKIKGNFYILTLAIMLLLYSITQLIKGNGAIACLVFGLVLGNSRKIISLIRPEENVIKENGKEFYAEVAFFIKTFFFVYLGILMTFSNILSFVWAGLIVLGIYFVRPIAVFLSIRGKEKLQDVALMETLIPKGLAAAVLVQLPIQAGIVGAETILPIALSVVLISILTSTVFVYLIEHKRFCGLFPGLHKRCI